MRNEAKNKKKGLTLALLPIIHRSSLISLVKHQRRQVRELNLAVLVAHHNLRGAHGERRPAVGENVDVEAERLATADMAVTVTVSSSGRTTAAWSSYPCCSHRRSSSSSGRYRCRADRSRGHGLPCSSRRRSPRRPPRESLEQIPPDCSSRGAGRWWYSSRSPVCHLLSSRLLFSYSASASSPSSPPPSSSFFGKKACCTGDEESLIFVLRSSFLIPTKFSVVKRVVVDAEW